jgi:hypothetical protein
MWEDKNSELSIIAIKTLAVTMRGKVLRVRMYVLAVE